MNITVLGAGLVGGPIAKDLAAGNEFNVTSVDKDNSALDRLRTNGNIKCLQADFTQLDGLQSAIRQADLVVSAVPGFLGFSTLKTIIEAGKNAVDIAFCPEDVMELHELALQKGVTVISDMGLAPGMSNLLAAYASRKLGDTMKIAIYVGGLPKKREGFLEYKAVFSPIDVIEEYTRPARVVEGGKVVVKLPLTDIELLLFSKVGALEAFNSDGLRSLVHTMKVPEMVEKTLRYPGHAEKIKILSDAGFFSKEKVVIRGAEVSPLEIAAKVLLPKWKLEEEEEDFTVMRIIVENLKERITWELLDTYDQLTRIHSMGRTTGYTAAMAARMITSGLFTTKGVIMPELLAGNEEWVKFILDGLAKRGIHYNEKTESL